MLSFLSVRRVARGAALALLLGSVAGCSLPWALFPTSIPTPSPTATSSPTSTPTPTPTPMSTLDSFKAMVTSSDFQAQGPVAGSILAKVILGSASGTITGTFKVKGGDSAVSITSKILGITVTYDTIVVGGWAYSRSNGGDWSKAPASGKTLQSLMSSGIVLTDAGVEAKFGKQLHHLTVANAADVDLSALGITAGPDQSNLTVGSLSFWSEADGTPAGVSIEASLDQKIFGTQSHETVTLDISIDSLSGVTITAPTP